MSPVGGAPDPGPTPAGSAALEALAGVARRLDAAARIEPAGDADLLQAIARTAATILDAEAASIALHDPDGDRLVFVAAAGPSAGDVVGLAIDAAAGIAGYAFSTSQPLAVADAAADPRFDRTVAEATGYVPGTILATPLRDEDGTLGVLEVLDRRGGTFTLRDLEVAAVLAAEAGLAVRIGRRQRDASALLRAALVAAVEADAAATHERALDADDIDALVTEAVASAPVDPEDAVWRLADRVARLREIDPDSIDLVVDWLDALLRRRGRRGLGTRR